MLKIEISNKELVDALNIEDPELIKLLGKRLAESFNSREYFYNKYPAVIEKQIEKEILIETTAHRKRYLDYGGTIKWYYEVCEKAIKEGRSVPPIPRYYSN